MYKKKRKKKRMNLVEKKKYNWAGNLDRSRPELLSRIQSTSGGNWEREKILPRGKIMANKVAAIRRC